jgi:peptide deformylase
MSVLPVTVYGDQILRQKTKEIEAVTDELIFDIKNMWDTMRTANGIGLAANQVGLNKSLFIIDISVVEDYEHVPPVVMINPQIIELSDEIVVMEEGCLSLPNLRADVERSEIITVKYLDTDEKEHVIEAGDLFARVILHEYDHLIGKMIPDRVEPRIKRKLQKDLIKIMKREVEIDYPITERKKV